MFIRIKFWISGEGLVQLSISVNAFESQWKCPYEYLDRKYLSVFAFGVDEQRMN